MRAPVGQPRPAVADRRRAPAHASRSGMRRLPDRHGVSRDRTRGPYDAVVTPWADGPGIVEFPNGRRVRGRGLRYPMPAGLLPEFGVYLLRRDPGPFHWEHRWVRWPDFRIPTSTDDSIAALVEAYGRSASERVELACGGGVGRTGTALAAIAVLAGIPRSEAVAWVRRRYNHRAVETPWQRRWVMKVDLAGSCRPR